MIDELYKSLGVIDAIILTNSLSVDVDVFMGHFYGCKFNYESLSKRDSDKNLGYQEFFDEWKDQGILN